MRTSIFCIGVILFGFSIGCEKHDPSDNIQGITFTRILSATGDDYELGGNIADYDEILGYDSAKHIFLLSKYAGERIRSEKYPVSPTKFAITVDGHLIYVASFIPGYSSMSCHDCITFEPYSYDNKYRVKLGYPSSEYFSGSDPRNDNRIILRLKEDNKLIDID